MEVKSEENIRKKHLGVVAAVLLSHAVPAEGVVVEAGVLHQCYPLLPARGHVGAVVLVQILPEEGWGRNEATSEL